MSRYGYQAQLDPRVNVYHDDDMDFSRGSFGRHPRAIPIKEPEGPSSANSVSSRFEHPSDNEQVGSDHQQATKSPAIGSYVAWTGGVQYSDPKHAVVDPISNEELLESLAAMRLDREKKRGDGPKSPSGPNFGFGSQRDNGYGPRDNGFGVRQVKPAAAEGWGANDAGDTWGTIGDRPARAGGGNDCFNCGQPGHRSAECTEERKPRGEGGCFKCGEEGHFSRECPNGASAGGRACFNCGQPGHESRECDQERVPGAFRGECYNCGQQGHASRDCVNDRKPGAFRGACHNCGEQGHQSRECTKPRDAGGRYNDSSASWGGEAQGGNANDDDWGVAQTPRTPGLASHRDADAGGWGQSPVEEAIKTPAAMAREESGWGSAPAKQEDDWGGSPTPAVKSIPQAAPHAPVSHSVAGIHPDRLRMMQGGRGAFGGGHRAERDAPPHLDGGSRHRSQVEHRPQPPSHSQEPAQSTANDEYDGW